MKLTPGMAAVVTGGASGLGRASAQALADAGLKVAIFDINDEDGTAHAKAIGGSFHHVDIMDEQSVVDGFEAARAAHGQERVTVHCAMASKRGKTLGWDKEERPLQTPADRRLRVRSRRHPGRELSHRLAFGAGHGE